MKVLLISPNATESVYKKLGKHDEIGLGLLYLASSLKKNGFEVKVELSNEFEVQKILDGFQPDVVGVTCVTANYNTAIRVLKAVKSFNKSIITMIGGQHVTFTVKETLNELCVDYLIRGEGEEVLPELLKNIMKGKPYKILPGVCFKRNHRIYNQNSIALVKDLDKIPFPDRSFIKKHEGIYMICSRGCPFRCTFCSTSRFYNGVWRKRSIESILNELEGIENLTKNKAKVVFRDDAFTVDTKWTKKLCKAIIDKGLKFKWECETRIDSIDRDPKLLPLMKEAGCKTLKLGIESGVQEIINSFNKGITLEQAMRVAKKVKDNSLYQAWYYMIGSGNRYDKPKYIKKSVEFIKTLPFDLIQISLLTPLPGTKLYDKLNKEGRIFDNNWDHYDGTHCVYNPLGMSSKQMEQELINAYKEIYLKSGFKNFLRRTYNANKVLVISKGFFSFLKVFSGLATLKHEDLFTKD